MRRSIKNIYQLAFCLQLEMILYRLAWLKSVRAFRVVSSTPENDTTVQAGDDGSFSGDIHAQLGDEIKIVMMDDAGNQTLITYITFKSEDGKYLVTAKGGTVTDDASGAKLEIPEGALYGPTVIKITPVTEDQLPQDNPVPQQAKFLAAVNIDTNGVKFQKEVKLSVPKPTDMPADATPFVAQPAVHTYPDGTQEKVYVIYDSAKIIDNRLTTASLPFDGVWGFGIFAFLYPPEPLNGPVVFSGYTYRDIDGYSGYNPQIDANNSTDNNTVYLPGSDLPISGAVVRCVGAENFISYSDSKGQYATYGFTAPDVCRSFDTTAIHPQTMNRVTAKLEVCDAPYIRNNFNYQLADKDTEIKDITPPTINMNMSVLSGQEGNPQFVSGTIPKGTEIELTPFYVIDQKMGTVQLVVSFQSSTMLNQDCYSVQANPLSSENYDTMMDQHNQPVTLKKYFYKPDFDTAFPAPCSPSGAYTPNTGAGLPMDGSQSQYFKPGSAGTYKFTLYAKDEAGNTTSKTIQVRAVVPGEVPISGTEGPPTVDEIVPVNGAKDTMVTLSVTVTMSEPVKDETINENTLKLLDHGPISSLTLTPKTIPAVLTTTVEGGRVKAVLTPKSNLMFSRKYEVVINDVSPDQRIQDKFTNNSGENLPMEQVYRSVFYTKVPQVYDLPPLEQGEEQWSGRDIALYTDPDTGRTFTYITADADGYYVVDVTDPTKPVITGGENMSNAGVSWRYKGAAVDQEQKLLAMTEDIFYYGTGNQYGYIRFYDLRNIQPNPATPSQYSNDPGDPHIIGREQLTEAYSGIPMRLALLGDYAYVATVNLGLQVVDIKKAKQMMQEGKHSDGSTIVGVFDTVDLPCTDPDNPTVKFCGQPMDISVYRNSTFPVGLLATRSGHLVVLDLSIPQDTTLPPLPRLIEAFKPAGYSAWRIAVATEYAYTPSPLEGEGQGEGGTLLIDLAVTAGHNGKINTVDLTDPYKPTVMGVTKDSDGNEVTATVTDIAISKTSGIAYATAGASVYVIDIKDPYNPKLLNIITEVPVNCPPTSDNCTQTTALGTSTALVEKDGWVYLANQQYGMRALDLDPVNIGIEDYDKEFEKIKLLSRDYYPALGTKAFRIWGVISDTKTPLDNNWEICLTENINNFKVGVTLNQNGAPNALDAVSTTNRCGGSFGIENDADNKPKGYITLYVKWDPISTPTATTTPTMPEIIDLKVMAKRKNVVVLATDGSDPNASEVCKGCKAAIRHNGNVTLEQVLNGKAVFTYDCIYPNNACGPAGVTGADVTDDKKKKFDFVQELLNQVVPRKRSVSNYILTEEDGVYNTNTYTALKKFKDNFSLGVNDKVGSYSPLGGYSSDPTLDNTTNTFRKLMKDYNKRQSGNSSWLIDGAAGNSWLYKVIDKETLVGQVERIPNWFTELFTNGDYQINFTVGNTRNDTGIYELYKNVVEKFVEKMIAEGETYRQYESRTWYARTGEKQGPGIQDGNGISYCYGCKDDVQGFDTYVSLCTAPSATFISNTSLPWNAYRGKLNESTCTVDATSLRRQWPGLRSSELYTINNNSPFWPTYWSGVDCSGFIQRLMMAGKTVYAISLGLNIDVSALVFNHTTDTVTGEIAANGFIIPNRSFSIGVDDVDKIRRGDIIQYTGSVGRHVSMVHSNRPDSVSAYDIVHASGDDKLCYAQAGQPSNCPFNRKVVVNSINNSLQSDTLKNPTGFGRIKLWD